VLNYLQSFVAAGGLRGVAQDSPRAAARKPDIARRFKMSSPSGFIVILLIAAAGQVPAHRFGQEVGMILNTRTQMNADTAGIS